MRSRISASWVLGVAAAVAGGAMVSSSSAAVPKGPAAVDAARITAADREPGNWMSYGRTYDEQRFSPLTQVDAGNAKRLGLAWSFDLDTAHRGQESTPLVVDGVMYVTGAWSKVYALDARTGAVKWRFDPKVPGAWAVNACCDVVNRGVAAWKGRSTSARSTAAWSRSTRRPASRIWEVKTVDPGGRYTITGAPRIVKGKVIIGNGGAEMGIRGYVSAYDADTGKKRWRFYTVPGDPSKPRERGAREGREDLERRLVEIRRRRNGVGLDRLRSEAQSRLYRRRQRHAVEPTRAAKAATICTSRRSSR